MLFDFPLAVAGILGVCMLAVYMNQQSAPPVWGGRLEEGEFPGLS